MAQDRLTRRGAMHSPRSHATFAAVIMIQQSEAGDKEVLPLGAKC